MTEKFKVIIKRFPYPSKKKERKGTLIEYIAKEYFYKKGYYILVSKYEFELDNHILSDYPTFFKKKFILPKIKKNKKLSEKDEILKEVGEEQSQLVERAYNLFERKFKQELSRLRKIKFGVGKPDLFIFNEKEFFFCEVKSHNDSWSKNQIRWYLKNKEFPYVLFLCEVKL